MKKAMEPKVIKEESAGEKDASSSGNNNNNNNSSSFVETPPIRTTRSSKGGITKERCKTPDSPEGARATVQCAPVSPTQSSPARHTNGSTSPPMANNNNGSAGSLTPPLPLPTVTASTAPLSVQLDNGVGHVYPATAAVGSYATCITRPLVKVKRFLSTLVQFGGDISPDVGERVRTLVLNLVSSNLSIEDFHQSLQDVTNFPLRPFVLPFLRAHLPLLQREIHALARTNKQSALQYVRTHDHVVLDPAHSPTEPSEIFLSNETQIAGFKRRASDSLYENGLNGQTHSHDAIGSDYPPMKRAHNSSLFLHQSLLLPNITSASVPSAHFFDYSSSTGASTTTPAQTAHIASSSYAPTQPHREDGRGDEEWRSIHVMLNCILSMVEKTKRALTILQQRNAQDVTGEWLRKQDVGVDLKKAANEILVAAVRQTEERVADVRRRAEEAVNDVKRQAVLELQKAVAAAECKANELVAAERAKMEKMLADARKHTEEGGGGNHVASADGGESSQSSPSNTQPAAPSQQNCCWNCGRKAHETCSGCSLARYCGPFCQHKDWENHHQICSKEKLKPMRSTTPTAAAAAVLLQQHQHTANQPDAGKFKK